MDMFEMCRRPLFLSEQKVKRLFTIIKHFHLNLKFTHTKSRKLVDFLDVIVSIKGNEFETDLYCNRIDCHNFLSLTQCILYI